VPDDPDQSVWRDARGEALGTLLWGPKFEARVVEIEVVGIEGGEQAEHLALQQLVAAGFAHDDRVPFGWRMIGGEIEERPRRLPAGRRARRGVYAAGVS